MNGFPFSDKTQVTIGNRLIPVRMAGSGRPILFLHGYPLDHRMWEPVLALLAQDFLCVAPDLRGFGRAAEESKSFSICDLADDCAQLIAALQIRRPAIVCGLSMGGYVAMECVHRYPQLVSHLVLANTRCNAENADGAAARRQVANTALRDGVAIVVTPMLEKLVCRSTIDQRKAVGDSVNVMMMQIRASTIAWAQLAMSHREEFTERMKSWKVPTLCIGGDSDPITPKSVIEYMSSIIPNARLKIIEEASHLTPLEQPLEFANAIREFVG